MQTQTQTQTQTLTGSGGVNLVYDKLGPADGQPVVLLHGGGQTRGSWGSLAVSLAAEGYNVLSLDLRGHGESEWAPDGDYAFSSYRDDVRALVSGLAGPPIMIGASLGGLAALLAVGEEPQIPARALVLVDITPWIDAQETSKIAEFMMARPEGFADLEDAGRSIAEYLPHRRRPDDLSGLARSLKPSPHGRLKWHWDPAIMRPAEGQDDRTERMVEAARKVSIPALLVRGALSRIVTRENVAALSRIIPDLHTVEVAGAGHMVAGDSNGAFDRVILDFFRAANLTAALPAVSRPPPSQTRAVPHRTDLR